MSCRQYLFPKGGKNCLFIYWYCLDQSTVSIRLLEVDRRGACPAGGSRYRLYHYNLKWKVSKRRRRFASWSKKNKSSKINSRWRGGDGVCSISTSFFLLLEFPFTNLFFVIESSTAETLTSIDFSSCRDITNMLVYFLIILPLI